MDVIQMQYCLHTDCVATPITFICWKSTIETLEKGMKYVQS